MGRRHSGRLGLFPQADLALLTEKVRRRVVRWFRMQRLSVRRGADGRIAKVRYVLPRHKAANWVGPGCGGDIRLIAFITDPGPIRKILTHVLLHTEWRTARASASISRPWPADRLGRARAGR